MIAKFIDIYIYGVPTGNQLKFPDFSMISRGIKLKVP